MTVPAPARRAAVVMAEVMLAVMVIMAATTAVMADTAATATGADLRFRTARRARPSPEDAEGGVL